MSLIDKLVGGIGSSAGGSASPLQGVVGSLLGGGHANTAPIGTTGGIAGLISMSEGAGLGGVAHSWVGNGTNQPVSPDQLRGVFGRDQVQSMASQSGLAPHNFLSQLSRYLPNAVNAATPNGRLPDEGSVSV